MHHHPLIMRSPRHSSTVVFLLLTWNRCHYQLAYVIRIVSRTQMQLFSAIRILLPKFIYIESESIFGKNCKIVRRVLIELFGKFFVGVWLMKNFYSQHLLQIVGYRVAVVIRTLLLCDFGKVNANFNSIFFRFDHFSETKIFDIELFPYSKFDIQNNVIFNKYIHMYVCTMYIHTLLK